MLLRWILPLALTLTASACSPTSPSPSTPPDGQPPATATPTPTGETPPAPSGAARASLTAEECQSRGGTVVGDIGNGAIHRPDYTCPSGAAPLGNLFRPLPDETARATLAAAQAAGFGYYDTAPF